MSYAYDVYVIESESISLSAQYKYQILQLLERFIVLGVVAPDKCICVHMHSRERRIPKSPPYSSLCMIGTPELERHNREFYASIHCTPLPLICS